MAEAKKALAESGYDGTPVVVMAPGDVVDAEGAADRGGAIAARSRLQGRRAGHRLADRGDPPRQPEAVKEGGWNMFFTNWVGADVSNPVANVSVGGRGTKGGWFGWAEDAKVEQMRDAFARARPPKSRRRSPPTCRSMPMSR